ncbi:DUF190 domain-containing protein [Egibacter rhizosphaerae]|uniref:DUF190 domain-containing protein n=1 Tax=Egibacter rhizosphaerae TaxID=1670831 RepID=UPI003B82EC66
MVPSGRSDRLPATAVRLTVLLGESDTHDGRPVGSELVRRAREHGLAGATLLRGIEGFGASNVVHRAALLSLSDDLPLVLMVVDAPERVERFLGDVEELVEGGLVLRERVEVVKYEGRVD